MASTSPSSVPSSSVENIPQWKKDLIQRRRQQTKVLANNGASVKLCTAVIAGLGGAESFDNGLTSLSVQECVGGAASGGGGSGSGVCVGTTKSRTNGSGDSQCVGLFASHHHHHHHHHYQQHQSAAGGTATSATDGGSTRSQTPQQQQQQQQQQQEQQQTVAGNMRLETDVLLCSDSDYGLNTVSKMVDNKSDARITSAQLRSSKSDMELSKFDKPSSEDGESDSSEELQYGPGIVNRLKSKYLNLTLREMNKARPTAQNFRRAASLEDLLDCDDDRSDKSARKYAKRNAAGVPSAKSERYRNVNRGNDSMKRARSVETLLRYNSSSDDVTPHVVPSRFTAISKHEPPSDHIILIDRTSVKIESKLGDPDRPKPLNKPRRVKLVVDETERPPPDLVKTTMRIFEGSTKKLKPKGEVAAKVATFKTINDTFKAQNQKKIMPKPALQPKPFANGIKAPGSPKKMTAPSIPTVERLEHPDLNEQNDGVITEPIVQSVSSVVSKFQQIEKLQSPSPSPEPNPSCKFKSSPIPSPEPPLNKLKRTPSPSPSPAPESKSGSSPPLTPEPRPSPAPRISPPKLGSPLSPEKEIGRQNSWTAVGQSGEKDVHRPTQQNSGKVSQDIAAPDAATESPKPEPADERENCREVPPESQIEEATRRSPSPVESVEELDGGVNEGKSISKTALENIGKAGTTMQFKFNDRVETGRKNYLPGIGIGIGENGRTAEENQIVVKSNKDVRESGNGETTSKTSPPPINAEINVSETPSGAFDGVNERQSPTSNGEATAKTEKEEPDAILAGPIIRMEVKTNVESNKPIGAISSLGLMKSNAAPTSHGQCNKEPKTIIKTQKTETTSPPQKQIGIIRPLVSTKTQLPQQNLSNREMEKNLINRVKSIEQPTKVVVSLKSSADEIQPAVKKITSSGVGVQVVGGGGGGGGGGGLWDTKPWNDQNNTMVFNFSNRKDVPDYIENDGLRVRRKRAKPKAGGDGGVIVLDATLDASTTDETEWEMTGGPPSPCNVSFLNDNILINGRSNLSKQPRNHKHRIQFDDTATRTFEYPSEASMLVGEASKTIGDSSVDRPDPVRDPAENRPPSVSPTPGIPSVLGGGGLASFTPSKVDLASEGFELGVTRATPSSTTSPQMRVEQPESLGDVDYLKPAQDAGAWGSETTADLLF